MMVPSPDGCVLRWDARIYGNEQKADGYPPPPLVLRMGLWILRCRSGYAMFLDRFYELVFRCCSLFNKQLSWHCIMTTCWIPQPGHMTDGCPPLMDVGWDEMQGAYTAWFDVWFWMSDDALFFQQTFVLRWCKALTTGYSNEQIADGYPPLPWSSWGWDFGF